MTISTANINSVWGSLLVEELIRHGVTYFCLAPGSRSTPLTASVAANPQAQSFIHFDERGLAFHALGWARASGRPAAIICTSGTAVANCLPAVVEASVDSIPLILLTADRPPELRDAGANQAILQPGIFGCYTRWSFDLPCPDRTIPPEMLLTTIDQAVYRARRSPSGPAHLNCMFREPLAPADTGEDWRAYLSNLASWRESSKPYTSYSLPSLGIADSKVAEIAEELSAVENGVMLVGTLYSDADRSAVDSLARKLAWPVFADITSGLRLGKAANYKIPFFNLGLTSDKIREELRPSTILHIGGRMTSKRLLEWLADTPLQSYVHVASGPFRTDPSHRITHRVETDIWSFCRQLETCLNTGKEGEYLSRWQKVSQDIDQVIESALKSLDTATETGIARAISRVIPSESTLFLASSMPIRDVDIFASTDGSAVKVGANRGVSGIDGTIASAAGFATALDKPTTLLIGDLALLHDLNSLDMLRRLGSRWWWL